MGAADNGNSGDAEEGGGCDDSVPPPKTAPSFSANLVLGIDGWSVYGTLGEITEDMAATDVTVELGGKTLTYSHGLYLCGNRQ